MLHTLHFSLQNAFYFIMLPFFVPVLFTFYIECVLKFKCKSPVPRDNDEKFYFVSGMQLARELQTSTLLLETGERMMIGLSHAKVGASCVPDSNN
jgi:hypothetical protein